MLSLRTITALIAAVLLLSFIGCKKSSSTSPTVESHDLTIVLRNYFPPDTTGWGARIWLVVASADGTTPIAARQITHNGNVEFGDVGSDHVSLSVVTDYGGGSHNVTTYLHAPAGTWLFTNDFEGTDTLGHADITTTFPSGQNRILDLSWTGGGYATTLADTATSYRMTVPVMSLEDISLTIMASLYTIQGGVRVPLRAGWLVAQPFVRLQTNPYQVALNNLPSGRTVTASRPLSYLVANASRSGQRDQYYDLWAQMQGTDSMTFTVAYPDLPASFYFLYGGYNNGESGYNVAYSLTSLPSSMNIAEGSVTATADLMTKRFTNITTTGSGDVLTAIWENPTDSWTVVSPLASEIGIPTVPDSILQALNFFGATLAPSSLWLDDYDTASNMDDWINLNFKNGAPMPQRYHVRSSFYHTFSISSPDGPNRARRHSGQGVLPPIR